MAKRFHTRWRDARGRLVAQKNVRQDVAYSKELFRGRKKIAREPLQVWGADVKAPIKDLPPVQELVPDPSRFDVDNIATEDDDRPEDIFERVETLLGDVNTDNQEPKQFKIRHKGRVVAVEVIEGASKAELRDRMISLLFGTARRVKGLQDG